MPDSEFGLPEITGVCVEAVAKVQTIQTSNTSGGAFLKTPMLPLTHGVGVGWGGVGGRGGNYLATKISSEIESDTISLLGCTYDISSRFWGGNFS